LPKSSEGRGLARFFGLVAVLFAVRVVLGAAEFPAQLLPALDLLSAAVFVGVPVVAVFSGASHAWRPSQALALLVAGAAVHAGAVLAGRGLPASGWPALLVASAGQAGLLCWCMALGALVAGLVKERNLLVPVGIFLAGLDALLVFHPGGPVARIVAERPEVFTSVALAVPAARGQTGAVGPQVEPFAYVGPADLFFSAMFFVCLFRFGMRTRETAAWLVPALVAYLCLAFVPGLLGMLPALVPIGITVVAVNWREFNLDRSEKAMTAGVAVLAVAMAAYGVWARAGTPPAPPAGPSLPAGGQAPPGQEG
jgi:hypothetical protein